MKDQLKNLTLKGGEKKLLNFEIKKEDSKTCQLDFSFQEGGQELAKTSVVLKPLCQQPIDFDQDQILSGMVLGNEEERSISSFDKQEKKLNPELQSAFDWAVDKGLVENSLQEKQKFLQPMKRIELAQMLIHLSEGFGKSPNVKKACQFADLEKSPEATRKTAELVCQLDLMGIHPDQQALENFMPDQLVDRAQMITVLSRFLWGSQFNQ